MAQNDRNLLLAIFAVQLKAVPAEKIIQAGALWALQQDRSIGDILVETGALNQDDLRFVDQLVDKAIEAHHGSARQALDAVGGDVQATRTFHGSIRIGKTGHIETVPMVAEPFLRNTEEMLSTAEEIPGRYSFISDYARGGMGRVLLVHDQHFGRQVALKELLMDDFPSEPGSSEASLDETVSMAARFLQEARVTGQLEHPSIVPVYELGRRNNGTLYYTMKFVRGRTLSHAIAECKTLVDRLNLLPHLIDLCNAIAYAHSRSVIHRDIKPSNIMVGEFGETVVLDWGIAKLKGVEDAHLPEIRKTLRDIQLGELKQMPETAYGRAMGTPNYMPPEQASGRLDEIDERSDVYSLGAVLYEMLKGEPPFTGASILEVMLQVVGKEPDDILTVEPDAPRELVEICRKAMSKNRSERYASAMELAEEIRRFQSGALVQAYKYSPGELVRHYYERNRTIINTVAAALILLLGVLSFSYVRIYNARNAEMEAREEAEYNGYVSQIRLAQAQIEQGNLEQAEETLWSTPIEHRHWEWGYLLNRSNPNILTIEEPGSQIYFAAYSPDGTRLATSSFPAPISLWDSRTGSKLQSFHPPDRMNDISWSPDGKLLVAGSNGGAIYVWETESGNLLFENHGHRARICSVAVASDNRTVLSTAEDNTVRIWDAKTQEQLASHDINAPVSATWGSDSDRFLVHCNQSATVFDRATCTPVFTVPGRNGTWSPDNRAILTLQDNTLFLYDGLTGAQTAKVTNAHYPLTDATWSMESDYVIATSLDQQIYAWSAPDGQPLWYKHQVPNMRKVTISPSNDYLVIASYTEPMFVVSLPDLNRIATYDFVAPRVQPIFHPMSHEMALAGIGSKLHVVEPRQTLYRTTDLQLDQGEVAEANFYDDGRWMTATCDGMRLIVDLDQAVVMDKFLVPGGGEVEVIPTPEGYVIVVAGSAILFDPRTRTIVQHVPLELTSQRCWAYSPTQDLLLTGNYRGEAQLLHMSNGQPLKTWTGFSSSVQSCAVSNEGHIALALIDDTLYIGTADAPDNLHTVKLPAEKVRRLLFDSMGRFLYVFEGIGRTTQCEADTGVPLRQFTGYSGIVSSIAFTPDNERTFTVSGDGLREWNTATGEQLLKIIWEQAFPLAATLLSNGHLRTVDSTGLVQSWLSFPSKADGEEEDTKQRADFERNKRDIFRSPMKPLIHVNAADAPATVLVPEYLWNEVIASLDTGCFRKINEKPGVQYTLAGEQILRHFGIRPGDFVVSLGNAEIDSEAALLASLRETLNQKPSSIHLKILRDGQPLVLHLFFLPSPVYERSVSLTREQALEMLAYEIDLMRRSNSLLELAQERGREWGLVPKTPDEIRGFYFSSTGQLDDPSVKYMRTLGLAPFDRLHRLNGVTIDSYSGLIQLYENAKGALESGERLSLKMEVERNIFQRFLITVEIL